MSADVEALRDVMRDVYMTRAQREAFDALLAAYDARSAVLSEQADTIQDAEAAAMQARQTAEYWKAEHLAGNAAYEALVAELATERDLHNRIARNFDHYSKEWVALKDLVEAAPVAMTDGYAVWTTEGMEDLPDWRRKVRVRLLLVREGGDGK